MTLPLLFVWNFVWNRVYKIPFSCLKSYTAIQNLRIRNRRCINVSKQKARRSGLFKIVEVRRIEHLINITISVFSWLMWNFVWNYHN